MSTIVFHHGALGDGVLIWPWLRALGELTLAAPKDRARLAASVLPGVTPIDEDSPEFARLYTPGATMEVSHTVRKLLEDATRVISFVSSGRDAWAENVRALAPAARCVFAEPRPAGDGAEPVMMFHRRQLHDQGLMLEPVMPPRRYNPDGPVVIHPGSGGRDKCWPAERFEAVGDHLNQIGRPIRWLIGEAERDRLDAETLGRWREKFDVVKPYTLAELARWIGQASVYLGNDSGPTQLAAAMGLRVVALFGPTDPRIWAPLGPAVRVLWSGEKTPMTWLPIDPVTQAIA